MVITLSGVTGVGKSYFKKQIQEKLGIPAQTIITTREKRDGEIDGIDKKFVNDEEFEDLKRKKEIVVTFEMLGYKYGYPRKEMESNQNSVVELHYPIIYQLKKEVKNTFSIYMIPKDIEIAKQNLKQRKLNPKIEKDRLKEIEEHVKNFKANKELREQFDYIFYNDYTENSVNKLIDILKNKCMKKVII